jgi:Uma2 family endonuclease
MSQILEEPAVRQAVYPISVEFYHQLGSLGLLDRNTELLDGVIVRKMSKSPLHSWVARELSRIIAAALRPGQLLIREDPITMDTSEPEPDIAVVEGDNEDYRQEHPRRALLVVEVAISSVELDRRKASIYAGAGIPEYWLVEPESARVTVFRRPQDGAYLSVEVREAGQTLDSVSLPGLKVELARLFRH